MISKLELVRKVVRETKTSLDMANKEAEITLSPKRKEIQSTLAYVRQIKEDVKGYDGLNREEAEVVRGVIEPVVERFNLGVKTPELEVMIGTTRGREWIIEVESKLDKMDKDYR